MSAQDHGRVGKPTGLSSPTEPQSSQGLGPSGFDPSRIIALSGDRYSPNLRKFIARQSKYRAPRQRVYNDARGIPYIGFIDDGWFMGGKLWRVLCVGTKAETYAYPQLARELVEVEDFWPRYERIGRCAIDEDHSRWWINGDSRWDEQGDSRRCRWCGHEQVRRRWSENVERERWEPRDSDGSPKGGDACGSVRSTTARAEGIAHPSRGSDQ